VGAFNCSCDVILLHCDRLKVYAAIFYAQAGIHISHFQLFGLIVVELISYLCQSREISDFGIRYAHLPSAVDRLHFEPHVLGHLTIEPHIAVELAVEKPGYGSQLLDGVELLERLLNSQLANVVVDTDSRVGLALFGGIGSVHVDLAIEHESAQVAQFERFIADDDGAIHIAQLRVAIDDLTEFPIDNKIEISGHFVHRIAAGIR